MGKLLFMINKLTFWQVVKLLWDCEQWESRHPGHDDELVTKNGNANIFAHTAAFIWGRNFSDTRYTTGTFSQIVIKFLAKRLYKKVKARTIA